MRTNIVSLTDWHVPYEDKKALKVAFNFCQTVKPKIIIIHEAHDFYALSKYDKDPTRLNLLQNELDQVSDYLGQLRQACPRSKIILLKSNHLERLRKYIWNNAPAFAGLRSLSIRNLLELEKHKIEFKDHFVFRNFIFKRGDIIRKNSAYTAKAEFDKENLSGVSGHSHRLGQFFTRRRGGSFTWIESGCLCDLNPHYVNGVADWQHGLSLVSFKGKSKRFTAYPIPIIDYEIFWEGKTVH